jgi:hypothetical protein
MSRADFLKYLTAATWRPPRVGVSPSSFHANSHSLLSHSVLTDYQKIQFERPTFPIDVT